MFLIDLIHHCQLPNAVNINFLPFYLQTLSRYPPYFLTATALTLPLLTDVHTLGSTIAASAQFLVGLTLIELPHSP